MESNKYRSFPPAVPLKISKLLQYQYFSEIYTKYDCNFFRQILPYFSEIVTSNKLELTKFIYVPIENMNKVPQVKVGSPFSPEHQPQNSQLYQLKNQATFIKISYQVHIIFQYLMNLGLVPLGIQRMKFQDKFWLFTEGVVKSFCFNEIVFKKDEVRQKSIIFILQGEFKCMNRENKSFKTISKGYAIDANGYAKRLKFQQRSKRSLKKNETTFHQSKNNQKREEKSLDQKQEELYSLWSYSNNAKILVVDLSIVKKYSLFEDQSKSGYQTPNRTNQKPIQKLQIKAGLQNLMKYRRLKTQNKQNSKTLILRQKTLQIKKPSLFSCRIGTTSQEKFSQNPAQQIYDHEIVRSYIKESQLYHKLKKMKQFKKTKKILSQTEKIQKRLVTSTLTKSQLLPFFKQQLKQDKQKVIMKRRKTRQLWGNGIIHFEGKQNFINEIQIQNQKLLSPIQNSTLKSSNSQDSKLSLQKFNKSELSSFYLLKRNLYNMQYHKGNSFQGSD